MILNISRAILLILVCSFQNIYAQDVPKLTVPASPAFSILNFEPSAVMRPTNAKDLSADVLNSFDKNGKLLMNLGLEVSPYWLKSNPNLERKDYLRPNPGQAFLQSFSLSAATVKDSVSGQNKLGAGFRFKLSNGDPVDELATADDDLLVQESIMDAINQARGFIVDTSHRGEGLKSKKDAIDFIVQNLQAVETPKISQDVITEFKSQANTLSKTFKDSSVQEITAFLAALTNKREEGYKALAENVSNLLYQRKGFILEFAGATGFNTTKGKAVERAGFWGNASYYVSPDDLFTLTARYMFNDNNRDSAQTNFDVGLGFLKKTTNYNITIEAMFRRYRAEISDTNIINQPITRVEKEFTYRFAVQGSYMISKDISINLSLGKDFNSPFVSRSGFFSILGFNYSIFSKVPPTLTDQP